MLERHGVHPHWQWLIGSFLPAFRHYTDEAGSRIPPWAGRLLRLFRSDLLFILLHQSRPRASDKIVPYPDPLLIFHNGRRRSERLVFLLVSETQLCAHLRIELFRVDSTTVHRCVDAFRESTMIVR